MIPGFPVNLSVGALPPPPGAGFNSSQLVRCLSDLDLPAVTTPRQTLAEALSHWLAWTDAIALYGVLNNPPPAGAPAVTGQSGPAEGPDEAQRLRQELSQLITDDTTMAADTAGAADFVPYRRCYSARQQAMVSRIAALRGRLRSTLSAASPALAQLAALDAVLDQALLERERHLLGKVPALLEQHFNRLRRAQADEPDPRLAPAQIRRTVQAVLLAELDTRWQAIAALMAALTPDTAKPS